MDTQGPCCGDSGCLGLRLVLSNLLTLVLGSMRLTPYLLMAIKRISGKFGSVVCWQRKERHHQMGVQSKTGVRRQE